MTSGQRASRSVSPSTTGGTRQRRAVLSELVIVLRNLKGLAHEEVARRMGRSVAAVRMLWVRALARLRQTIQTAGEQHPASS